MPQCSRVGLHNIPACVACDETHSHPTFACSSGLYDYVDPFIWLAFSGQWVRMLHCVYGQSSLQGHLHVAILLLFVGLVRSRQAELRVTSLSGRAFLCTTVADFVVERSVGECKALLDCWYGFNCGVE